MGANVALAQSVGWLDTESDWRVLHGAALVLGVRQNGRLIGQGAVGSYGNAGTVAKMIVAPDFQRQRLGSSILNALLLEAEQRSIAVLGLVATPLGRPLYEHTGFTAAGEVAVLTGTPTPMNSTSHAAPLANSGLAVCVDERWLSCARAPMLHARFRENIATASCSDPDGNIQGYAMATEQGPQAVVGPVMAGSEADARLLASSIFCAVSRPIRIDVPVQQRDFRKWLQGIGLHEQGIRVEMARGASQLPWQVPQRYALATQAWG